MAEIQSQFRSLLSKITSFAAEFARNCCATMFRLMSFLLLWPVQMEQNPTGFFVSKRLGPRSNSVRNCNLDLVESESGASTSQQLQKELREQNQNHQGIQLVDLENDHQGDEPKTSPQNPTINTLAPSDEDKENAYQPRRPILEPWQAQTNWLKQTRPDFSSQDQVLGHSSPNPNSCRTEAYKQTLYEKSVSAANRMLSLNNSYGRQMFEQKLNMNMTLDKRYREEANGNEQAAKLTTGDVKAGKLRQITNYKTPDTSLKAINYGEKQQDKFIRKQYAFKLYPEGSRGDKIYRAGHILLVQLNLLHMLQFVYSLYHSPELSFNFILNTLSCGLSVLGLISSTSISETRETLHVLLNALFSSPSNSRVIDWTSKWYKSLMVLLVAPPSILCGIVGSAIFIGADAAQLVSMEHFDLFGFSVGPPYTFVFGGARLLANATRNTANILVAIANFFTFLAILEALLAQLEEFRRNLAHANKWMDDDDNDDCMSAISRFKEIQLVGSLAQKFSCVRFLPHCTLMLVFYISFFASMTFVVPVEMPVGVFCLFPMCLVIGAGCMFIAFRELSKIPQLTDDISKCINKKLTEQRRRSGLSNCGLLLEKTWKRTQLKLIRKIEFRAAFLGLANMVIIHKMLEQILSLVLLVKDEIQN